MQRFLKCMAGFRRDTAGMRSSATRIEGNITKKLVPRSVETPAGPGGPPALAASGRPSSTKELAGIKSGTSRASASTEATELPAAKVAGGKGGGVSGTAMISSGTAAGASGTDSKAGGSSKSKVGTGSSSAKLRIPLGGTSKYVASTVESLPAACTSVRLVSAAEAMNAAYRSTMEDAFVVVDAFGGDEKTGLFAVYDGHGGRFVAEYLRTHLHDVIERELLDKRDRSVEECLKSSFIATDIECSRTGEAASGATAILCIVREQGPRRYVYTANCGDARAVLCHDGKAVRLSMDHKATDEPEKRRVESAGGFVVRKRVMGVLAVARAFGDFAFKKFVTPEPFTSTTKLNAASHFLVIACDGVWDVLEDQEAVDIVREHVRPKAPAPSGTPPAAAAMRSAGERIVRESLRRGSTDNVTCLVVFL